MSTPRRPDVEPTPGARTARAVERVRAELAALPEIPMPPDVAERIGRAITDAGREQTAITRGSVAHGPVTPDRHFSDRSRRHGPRPSDGSRRRRGSRPSRDRLPRRAALVCVAASLVALVAGLTDVRPDAPRPVGRADDLRSAGAVAFGRDGAGVLADPARRRACLTSAGVPEPGAALLGGLPYAVDGTPATLLVLGTDVTGRYRAVVVDTGCRRVLAESVLGR